MAKSDIPIDIWENKRDAITRLYMEEEWPLKHVIKMIQTGDFRPSETQLRARLKKWHVTKPSRKKYSSGRRLPAEFEQNFKGPRSSENARGLGVDTNSPAPRSHSALSSTSEHEVHTLDEEPDYPDISTRHLNSLTTALDDYLFAPCSLPAGGEYPPMFPVTSGCHVADFTADTSTTPNIGIGRGLEDLFSSPKKNNEKIQVNSEAAERSFMPHTCVATDDDRGRNILPDLHFFSDNVDTITTPPVGSTTKIDTECSLGCDHGVWAMPYANPLAQYQAGLALCKHAIPRLSQHDRWKLQLNMGEATTHHEPRKSATGPTCISQSPSIFHVTSPKNERLKPCLACCEFSGL